MKNVLPFIVICAFLSFKTLCAQNFQGIATYKTKRNVDLKLDSTSMNSDLQKQMQEMLKKRFQKTFKLFFDKEASVYKEDESLSPPQVGSSAIQIQVVGTGGGSDILYKNTKHNTFTDQKDVLGKIFLVKDTLKSHNWKLEPSTKYIGEYKCYKATFTREVEVVSHANFSGASKSKEETTKQQQETQTVTAWYTPQIPVNNGPADYYGLPGLILEVNTGQQQIVCSKIILNPKEKVTIKEPTKGKEINQADYDKIMKKKRKEIMERYVPSGGRKDREVHLRIGG